jgi:type IV pilus biogenesis protein PilP
MNLVIKMKTRFLFAGLWAWLATASYADGGVVATQAQLDALNAENALLTVQLKNMELKEKIKNASQNNPALSLFPTSRSKGPGELETSPDARVVLVSGDPQQPVATILLDGAQIKARVGQIIPGLGVVKGVSLDEVLIQTRKSLMSLPFVVDPYSAPVGLGGMNGEGTHGSGMGSVPLPPLLNSHVSGNRSPSGMGAN